MRLRILFLLALVFGLATLSLSAQDPPPAIGYATADVEKARAAGFDFAELPIRDFMKLSDADFLKFVDRCRHNGLPLLAGYMFIPADLKVVGPDVKMNEVTNYMETALDRCQQLGIKIIAWGSGDSRRAPKGFPKPAAFQQLVALGKWFAPEAQKRGIVVVAEPLRRAEANTVNNVSEGLRWVEAVNHPNFQLLVDIFHMTQENEDMAIIRLAGPHIRHIHFSNPQGRVLPLSATDYDYGPFFGALKAAGYHGGISIETGGNGNVDLIQAGPKIIQAVRTAWASAGHPAPAAVQPKPDKVLQGQP